MLVEVLIIISIDLFVASLPDKFVDIFQQGSAGKYVVTETTDEIGGLTMGKRYVPGTVRTVRKLKHQYNFYSASGVVHLLCKNSEWLALQKYLPDTAVLAVSAKGRVWSALMQDGNEAQLVKYKSKRKHSKKDKGNKDNPKAYTHCVYISKRP